jgi:acetyl esterase
MLPSASCTLHSERIDVPLHPQAQAICDLTNATRVDVPPEQRVQVTREGWGLYLAMTGGEQQPVDLVEDRDADGVPVRVYRPSADPNLPILVVFHGGGWVIGSVEQYDLIARRLAHASGAIVVSVDYRLAPEHPYPAPLDDCWTAVRWTAAHASEIGGDASRIAVGGDSAGGNLAAVCALLARDAGGPALALQVLVYPVTDCDFTTESYVANGEGYLLDLDQMQWFFDSYTKGHVDPADWHVSPLRADDLGGVAPALVLTAEYDPLRDEGKAYADRLRAAGVAVEYENYEGMIHSFFGLPAYDTARDAMEFVATGLRRAFGTLGP